MQPRRTVRALLAGLSLSLASPAGADSDMTVAFGVLAFGGEAHARERWGQTVETLTARIPGHRFELVPLTLDGTDAALETRGLHFLLTNPGHYQSLMVDHGLAPLVSLRTDAPGRVRTGNRYGAVIFARAEPGGPKRLSDLRGRTFGAVAPDAFGGWHLALHTLRRQGLDPASDFADIEFFGFPQSAIVEAVLSGRIDAGTVRTGELERLVAQGHVPDGALVVLNPLEVPGFNLALSTALVPEWLIAATPAAGPDLRRSVAGVLLDVTPVTPGDAAWLTPQSPAPVIAIQAALADTGGAGPTGFARLAPWVAALVFAALAAAAAIRRAARSAGATQTADTGEPVAGPAADLTPRETEVLDLVEQGQTSKEIARTLSISPKTVEFHRHNLLTKFDAANMADLVRRAGDWRRANTPETDPS